jgi:two-component system cell cycle sensor histidine kinase/response regulator CckA
MPSEDYRELWKTITTGREWRGEFHNRKKGGELFWESASISPIFDAAGHITHFLAVKEDITERKQTAHHLTDTLDFNQKIISDASVGIVVFKASGRCVLANEAAARTLNATVARMLAQDFRQLESWRVSGMLKVAEEALATGKPRQCEPHFVTTFGKEVWLVCHLTPFVQGNEPHLLLLFNDVSEKKKLEAQFLRSQRMESIGTLAGGIAHDLNNVLTPLLVSIQMLKEKITDDDGLALLETLETNVRRGAGLVKQVLGFGRGVQGERTTIHPKHIVDEIRRITHETFPKSVESEFHSADSLWTITGDPTQLHQVLLNLCVNARDAMPDGGKLSIRMENTVLDETYAGLNLEARPGPYVLLQVTDNGMGIPKEIQERIFDPFFTTKASGKGTGLGLSTTLAIVKSHGGFINCYSEPGKGTTFKVYFPANTTLAAKEPSAVMESRLPHGHNELVLVVDDEEPIRKLTQRVLERFGYRVLLAVDGAEAVSLYTPRRKEIDVVIIDMAMPVMDGPAAIAALKAINPGVRIISSSGASDGGTAKVRDAGVRHFIPKPYTAETMLSTLHEVLHGNHG